MNGVVLLVGGLLLVAVIKLIMDRNLDWPTSLCCRPASGLWGLDTIQNRPF